MNNIQNLKKKEREKELKEKICRNDYQRAIWDIAKKRGLSGTISSLSEFWTFMDGFDSCMKLSKSDIDKIKKLK